MTVRNCLHYTATSTILCGYLQKRKPSLIFGFIWCTNNVKITAVKFELFTFLHYNNRITSVTFNLPHFASHWSFYQRIGNLFTVKIMHLHLRKSNICKLRTSELYSDYQWTLLWRRRVPIDSADRDAWRRFRLRLHWSQNRHNTANQHLSGYTSQKRVAIFNPTCVSRLQLDTFCPLQQHSNPMRTAVGIWPDCRLETNSLCWSQRVVGDNIPVGSDSV